MKYITYSERGWELTAYIQYTREHEQTFPEGARDFVFQPWHYDISHHQCPHDSWLEEASIRELAEPRKEDRKVQVVTRFLGAFDDGHFELIYDDVLNYSVGCLPRTNKNIGHGDWIIDEVILTDAGFICHEIPFDKAGIWSIVCRALRYEWAPI